VKFPAYPRTKPSGIEWLGEVPEHWTVIKVKFVAKMESGHTPSKSEPANWIEDDCVIPWVSLNDTKHLKENDFISDTAVKISEEGMKNSSAHLLPAGVVVFTRDATIGLTAITTCPAAVSQHIIAWVPGAKITAKYLLLSFKAMQQYLDSFTFGSTLKTIGMTDVRKLVMPVPSFAEQEAIAAYLDRATGRLDRLVAKKQELIERLKEKRTALISRTVTRGLPPAAACAAGLPENPPLKPSGVPWFDECPSHWQTKRLRHISDIIVVGVVVNPSSYVTDEGVAFLLGGDVRKMQIDTTDCKRCSPESSNGPLVKSRLNAGDLVVVRVGYPGVAAVVPPELEGGNVASMMLVRKHQRFCSQWLAYTFNSQVGRDQVEIVQYGAAQKQFNISHAVDFAFPFPPLPEQAAIAAYLDSETAKLDALVGKVEEAVERLQEYRTALITAAVTGKIDVRGVLK
jgi:type I restriction enzyme S subunit